MPEFFRRWLPLLGLVAAGALALWLQRPPRPRPATAPAAEFAAGRARADLDSLARRPHAPGTAEHARVQAYLLRRLRALGLQPRRQDTTVLLAVHGQLVLAHVQNIEARQPGTQPGDRAVLALAHYDSQPHTPGAGDDAAGVAALLETIRALRTGPALARDVIWLFTDGEESGLLGARAWAADTARTRRRVGVALNVEGRGNSGASLTFEVSEGNGWLLREYAQAAPAPLASSLFYEAYRRLPNDTDFTPLRQAGVAGLNFAFIGGLPYYHSPTDTPGRLELASVQHHGSYLLSLVRYFASRPLGRTKGPDVTFFNPLGTWLVHYPATWSWPLVAGAAVLLLLVAGMAQQHRRLAWVGLLGGAGLWLLGVGLVLAADYGLLAAVRALYPHYAAFYGGAFYNALAYQVALLLLGLAVGSWYYGLLGRWLPPDALTGGALLATLVLAAGLAGAAPTSAYLLTWPLLGATLGWAGRQAGRAASGLAELASWLLLLPTVALLVPVGYLLLLVFGLSNLVLADGLVLALVLGLALPLLLPVLRQPGRAQPATPGRPHVRTCPTLPLLALAGAAGALLWGHLGSQPTPEHPQQTSLAYYLDANTGRATWLSSLPHPDAYLQQALPQARLAVLPAGLPGAGAAPAWQQAAPTLPLPAPVVRRLPDTVRAGRRHLRLLLLPGRAQATALLLRLGPGALAVQVAGCPVPAGPLAGPGLLLTAPPPGGTLLELVLPVATHPRLLLAARTLGLPAAPGMPVLPPAYVPAPGYLSFTSTVKKEIGL